MSWLLTLRYDGLEVTPSEVKVPRYRRRPRTIRATEIVDIRTVYVFMMRTVRVRTTQGVFFLPFGAGYRFREQGYEVVDALGLMQKSLDRPSWPWAD
jgi:hypothetical protein